MTTIYLIRHGESVANAHHIYIGQTDLDLSPLGHKQAKKTASFLRDIPCGVIYSSDLCRAYHTAQYTAEQKGMEIITNKNLREIYAGEWENKTYTELMETYGEEYRLWREDIGNAVCTGGESMEELSRRFAGEVENLAKQHPCQNIFIFTHATCIRLLGAVWQKGDYRKMQEIPWATNASVTKGVYDGTGFKLVEYGRDDFLEAYQKEVSPEV